MLNAIIFTLQFVAYSWPPASCAFYGEIHAELEPILRKAENATKIHFKGDKSALVLNNSYIRLVQESHVFLAKRDRYLRNLFVETTGTNGTAQIVRIAEYNQLYVDPLARMWDGEMFEWCKRNFHTTVDNDDGRVKIIDGLPGWYPFGAGWPRIAVLVREFADSNQSDFHDIDYWVGNMQRVDPNGTRQFGRAYEFLVGGILLVLDSGYKILGCAVQLPADLPYWRASIPLSMGLLDGIHGSVTFTNINISEDAQQQTVKNCTRADWSIIDNCQNVRSATRILIELNQHHQIGGRQQQRRCLYWTLATNDHQCGTMANMDNTTDDEEEENDGMMAAADEFYGGIAVPNRLNESIQHMPAPFRFDPEKHKFFVFFLDDQHPRDADADHGCTIEMGRKKLGGGQHPIKKTRIMSGMEKNDEQHTATVAAMAASFPICVPINPIKFPLES